MSRSQINPPKIVDFDRMNKSFDHINLRVSQTAKTQKERRKTLTISMVETTLTAKNTSKIVSGDSFTFRPESI